MDSRLQYLPSADYVDYVEDKTYYQKTAAQDDFLLTARRGRSVNKFPLIAYLLINGVTKLAD